MPDTHPATLTNPRANTTLTSDITATPREVDFVSRFSANWNALREVMNIMNPVRKAPGTTIRSYTATVTLEDGNVPEGAVIPYSKAKVTPSAEKTMTPSGAWKLWPGCSVKAKRSGLIPRVTRSAS